MARIQVLVCVFVLAVLLVSPCSAARELRGDLHGRRLSPSVRRSLNTGDDGVPAVAKVAENQSKYNEWVHFQAEQLAADYPPAAANPSVPCC
ncbi:hypothetical protein M758_2G194300 [Ceratodon purpureus]|uniref:Uncharacterized protein n=1 Tax=Ceratodon purpureus TaxID=3225 RepID=A0A8T0J097_CERPU|nr:hypothetical protein KC19_2G240800 [Ceratodon purpureus]KAG0627355.1 hypothetical protein M758_2G194300 [Ceratodon purpureus]